MKNYYFVLLITLLYSVNTKAAILNKFVIQSQYLLSANALRLNTTGDTPFLVDVEIDRYLKDYGYENVDWLVTVVFQKNGEADLALSTTKAVQTTDFSGQTFLRFTLDAKLPAGKTGGKIVLKYSYLTYNNNGSLINDSRITENTLTSFSANIPDVPVQVGFNINNAHLFMANPSGLDMRKADYLSGGHVNFGEPEWKDIQGMTSLNGSLYVVQANNLHRVDKTNGAFSLIGELGIWPGTEAITSSTNGYLYIVQNSRIHKVNPTTGDFTIIGNPEWANTDAIVAYNGYLYLAENAHLYKVNENTGTYIELGDSEWAGTQGMASGGDGYIYIVQNAHLHKVNTETGNIQVLGGRDWADTNIKGVAFYNNDIYILQNYYLHRVNKDTGEWLTLGARHYSNSCYLTVI